MKWGGMKKTLTQIYKGLIFIGLRLRTFLRTAYGRTVSLVILAVMVLSIAGQAGLFSYIGNYLRERQRQPRALNSQTLPLDPAADSLGHGFAHQKFSKEFLDELAAQKYRQVHGEPKDLRHVKTLDEDRTAHSTSFLNADGSRSTEVSAEASSFKDKDGQWQEVDTTLAKDSNGHWKTKANAWQAEFGTSTDGVRLNKNGQVFVMVPVGGRSESIATSREC